MNDKDLFEQLRSGPFSRDGFDENLRRKINDNLANPRRGAKRPSFLRISAIGASFLLIAVVVVALWAWDGWATMGKTEELAIPTSRASESGAVADEDDEANRVPHSAVVIGLRKDESSARSSYRTVVVASEGDRLQTVGSGEGIWMPYEQDFWQIAAEDDTLGKGDQELFAYLKGVKKKADLQKQGDSRLRRTEKLLYAGDHYVVTLQTTNVDEKGNSVGRSEVLVNLLPTLASTNRAANLNALAAENVSLNEALGVDLPAGTVDRWAVVRENNAWMAKQAIRANGTFDVEQVRQWPTIDVPLESTNVVKDKPLALDWEEVKRLEPDAVDAFTSQDGDVALIVSNDQIQLVPYRLPESERNPVTIDLDRNESIVMVQWAIQEKYVENWKKWFTEWFADSSR
ncbi:hypothetical protein [Cohnella cellulosilytica]|uniref:Uncharacterized protein n=1 Tax=Cohnella cellulosilytica TaxID=986710 RepID=A0ABW2F4W0_9BACL